MLLTFAICITVNSCLLTAYIKKLISPISIVSPTISDKHGWLSHT